MLPNRNKQGPEDLNENRGTLQSDNVTVLLGMPTHALGPAPVAAKLQTEEHARYFSFLQPHLPPANSRDR